MNSNRSIILTIFYLLSALNRLLATDGVVVVNSVMPSKDISVLATQQIILKSGFKASAQNASFYASIGNISSITPGVIIGEGSGTTQQMSGNENTTIPMSLEKTYYPTQVVTSSANINLSNSVCMLDYQDGLGRNCLSILKKGTPKQNDIAQVVNYEVLDRVRNMWLPTPMDGIETNNPEIVVQQALNFFNDKYPYSTISNTGSTTTFCKPGDLHHSNSKFSKEELIDVLLDLTWYDVDNTGNLVVHHTESSEEYQLGFKKNVDEDGKTSYLYFDEYGNTVLIRKCKDESHFADTYYVYDDFNRLRYVLSPECTKLLSTPGTFSLGEKSVWKTDPLALYAYLYQYDEKGRCTAKKMPGKDWEYQMYDNNDRLIFSQDGNQRSVKKWTYFKYDKYNRLTQQGTAKFNANMTQGDILNLYNQNNSAQCDFTINVGYSQGAQFCTDSQVLRQLFYDNYDFLSTPSFSSYSDSLKYDNLTTGFGSKYVFKLSNTDLSTKGKLTGVVTSLLDNSGILVKAMYYDDNNRVIQLRANNHLGGFDKDYFAYNFNGALTARRHIHKTPYISVPIVENYTFQLDQFSRLLSLKHRINNQPEELISSFVYDELGRPVSKMIHNKAYSIDYTYNIQNQLKSIKSTKFNETLNYADFNSGKGCYNGSISAVTFGSQNDQQYTFNYDSQNRLKSALSGSAGTYNEQIGEYDDNGNIKTLQRYGLVRDINNNIISGLIDNLKLGYKGNQLQSVSDDADQSKVIGTNDFVDKKGPNNQDEYLYDANGNETADLNKGIAWILYNALNLPEKVQFQNGTKNEYLYDADGLKHRAGYNYSTGNTLIPLGTTTEVNIAPATYEVDYCGNYIYTRSGTGALKLSKIITNEGCIVTNDCSIANIALWNYEYNVKDHQNNTRVTLSCDKFVSNTPTGYVASAQTDYYPFGLEHSTAPQTNGNTLNSGTNPYLYGGKEIDRVNGLNMYDLSARWLDNVLPVFTTFDPLAVSRADESPYSYCGGDPVNRVDPTGLIWWINDRNDIKCQDNNPSGPGNIYTGWDELTIRSDKDADHYQIDYYGLNCTHTSSIETILKEVIVTAKKLNTTGLSFSLVNFSSFDKTSSNPSYSSNVFPSNQNLSQGDKNPYIRTTGFNALNQNSEQRSPAVDIQPLATPIVGLSTEYDNGTISATKLNAWQTGLDILRGSGDVGIGGGEIIYYVANIVCNLATSFLPHGSINLDGSYPFDNERRENIMNAWMLIGTLPMGGVAAQAKTAKTLAPFWPRNGGALGEWKYEIAEKGRLFSRYGLKSGTYVSPIETPFEMRGLSPNTSPYLKMNIQILEPFPMRTSTVAPAFDSFGFGIQHEFPASIFDMEKWGFIKVY